ncbi:MAG: hypothetical protein EBX62_04300 [Betaproteobacteria bacterium]|nr:hypothetical protein [Betaproteobacteria bacterium]
MGGIVAGRKGMLCASDHRIHSIWIVQCFHPGLPFIQGHQGSTCTAWPSGTVKQKAFPNSRRPFLIA